MSILTYLYQIISIKGLWANGKSFDIKKPTPSSDICKKNIWKGLCGAAPFLAIVTNLKLKTFPLEKIRVFSTKPKKEQLYKLIKLAEDWPNNYSLQWIWGDNIFAYIVAYSTKEIDANSLLSQISFCDNIDVKDLPGLNMLPKLNAHEQTHKFNKRDYKKNPCVDREI